MWPYYGSFNQKKCVDLDLTINDIYVFQYLEQFIASGQAKKIEVDVDGVKKLDYYFISYQKLADDCVLTHWKRRTFRQAFARYKDLGLISIYKNDHNSPKLYFRLNLDTLIDGQTWSKCAGIDTRLREYAGLQRREFSNEIQFCHDVFRYFSTGLVVRELVEYNKKPYRAYEFNSVNELFDHYLKKLVTPLVFSKYYNHSVIKLNEKTEQVEIHFIGAIEGMLDRDKFKIEVALVQTYLYIVQDIEARESTFKIS